MTALQHATQAQRNMLASPRELAPDFEPWFTQGREPPEPAGVWEPCRIGTLEPDLDIWSDRN